MYILMSVSSLWMIWLLIQEGEEVRAPQCQLLSRRGCVLPSALEANQDTTMPSS